MIYDQFDLFVTTDDKSAQKSINLFINNLLGFNPGLEAILSQAQQNPGCAMLQVYAAILAVFAQSKPDAFAANSYLDNALDNYDSLTEREQLWIQAIQASLENRFDDALCLYEAITKQWPRDLIAAKMIEFHCFETGESQRQLNNLSRIAADNNDNPHFLAMFAFAHEINEQYKTCIDLANRAIELMANNRWAFHALAHAYSSMGQNHNGIRCLRESEAIWSSGNQYIQAHMAFHLAMFYISEREFERAHQLYHQYIWNKQPDTVVEQTDAILLLWALEIAGTDVSKEWRNIAPHIEARSLEFNFPFLNVLYIYALDRAGLRDKAQDALSAMQHHASTQQHNDKGCWNMYGVPLAKACFAFAERDFEQASQLFDTSYNTTKAGGSDEQRIVFHQSYLTCLIQSNKQQKAKRFLDNILQRHHAISPLEKWWQQQIQ